MFVILFHISLEALALVDWKIVFGMCIAGRR